MAYRVDLTERAARNLRRIYLSINAESSEKARAWFDGLENAVFGLNEHPARGATIRADSDLRHLLYGRKWHRYWIIYAIEEGKRIVTVIHIRHGSRATFNPNDQGDDE